MFIHIALRHSYARLPQHKATNHYQPNQGQPGQRRLMFHHPTQLGLPPGIEANQPVMSHLPNDAQWLCFSPWLCFILILTPAQEYKPWMAPREIHLANMPM
jgi:hypothetical protein